MLSAHVGTPAHLHACSHMHTYTCAHTSSHVHSHVHRPARAQICSHLHTCAHACAPMHAHTHACIRVCTCTHLHLSRVHTHMLTPAHTHSRPPVVANLSPSDPGAGSSMPEDASCSLCLMPATPTLPPKPRKSSRSTGPPKDFGPIPSLQGCCSNRAVPQGQTLMVRPGAEGTLEPGVGGWKRGS